jgi:pyruvate ferredoxin oxidoreductase delta subunit
MSRKSGWRELPIGGNLYEPGSSLKYKTGSWRIFRPVLDEAKCTRCLLCWIYCPEPSIDRLKDRVEINYDFCKGCGICAAECPVKAIQMVEER